MILSILDKILNELFIPQTVLTSYHQKYFIIEHQMEVSPEWSFIGAVSVDCIDDFVIKFVERFEIRLTLGT